MKITLRKILPLAIFSVATLISCTKDDSTTTGTTSTTTTTTVTEVPAAIKSNYKSMVTLSISSSNIVLKSSGVPDHVTAYWGVGNSMYVTQQTGQTVTPGQLTTQNFVMTIPANPVEAATKEATSLGPIGMALNGVAIYNDREAGNVPVEAGTLTTFDRAGGHSGPGGLYHYHFTGDYTSKDDAKLIGFLRDGFPIYGRKDTTGTYPSNLDANGGHMGVTQDYPKGIYHYHAQNVAYMNSAYYILKAGSYYGTKGTFTF